MKSRRAPFSAARFMLLALLAAVSALYGCGPRLSLPPQVNVSEIELSGRPAKPANCRMTVLRTPPLADFRQVAIIEAVANVFDNESDVLPVVLAKACEIGADALLIKESRAQTSENLTGYYINGVAIVYQPAAEHAEKPMP